MNGRVPDWLADRLGTGTAAGSDGATWRLDSTWNWAPWATLLLLIFVVIWTVVLYSRESSSAGRAYRALLSGLRLAALGLLLIMLAQWAISIRVTGPPAVAVVLDRSTSMAIADRYDGPTAAALHQKIPAGSTTEPTRFDLAKTILTANDGKTLAGLAQGYRTELYLVAEGLEHLPRHEQNTEAVAALQGVKAEGPGTNGTRLGDGLMRLLDEYRDHPPAAIVLLTDGVNTAGTSLGDAVSEARRKGVPIFAAGLGRDQPPQDIELADVLVDDVVFAGDTVRLLAQIKASGLAGKPAKVTLRREGSLDVLAEQTITLPANGATLNVSLLHRPTEAGEVTYIVEIGVLDDEVDRQNNHQSRRVAVHGDKIRVLFVQGYPNYEFRFLKTLLERDHTIQLSTFLQDADPNYALQDKTALRSFPVDRRELFEYDVMIIGDVDPRIVPRSAWGNVKAFVSEKGGGVVFIAGPRFLPWLYQDNADMAALLPVDIARLPPGGTLPADVTRGYSVAPTPLGMQNSAFQLADSTAATEQVWNSLAPLYWLFTAEGVKPGAQILATGTAAKLPVICFQYFGAGRVLFHAIDSTWRWRLGAGDTYFARYWVQTIRFLARGKLGQGRGVELSTDRREYRTDEPVQLRARFLDMQQAPSTDEIVVMLDSTGRDRQRVVLHRSSATEGLFGGSVTGLPAGAYDVTVVEPALAGSVPTAHFAVVAPPGELAHTAMDSAALISAAELTHGKFYTFADADKLLADLPAGRRLPLENLPPIPIWNQWWLLTAFLTCLTSEWVLRKRKGMT